ncbi:MAG: hypothetical protein QF526_04315, partial [Alphaproteobacteria bacterium]|nr:hypothetical protein [Alphaproteobacteria bacterium]
PSGGSVPGWIMSSGAMVNCLFLIAACHITVRQTDRWGKGAGRGIPRHKRRNGSVLPVVAGRSR